MDRYILFAFALYYSTAGSTKNVTGLFHKRIHVPRQVIDGSEPFNVLELRVTIIICFHQILFTQGKRRSGIVSAFHSIFELALEIDSGVFFCIVCNSIAKGTSHLFLKGAETVLVVDSIEGIVQVRAFLQGIADNKCSPSTIMSPHDISIRFLPGPSAVVVAKTLSHRIDSVGNQIDRRDVVSFLEQHAHEGIVSGQGTEDVLGSNLVLLSFQYISLEMGVGFFVRFSRCDFPPRTSSIEDIFPCA